MGEGVVQREGQALPHALAQRHLRRMIVRITGRGPRVQVDELRREERVRTIHKAIPVEIRTAAVQARGIGRESKIVHILPEGAGTKAHSGIFRPVVSEHIIVGYLRRGITTSRLAGGSKSEYIKLEAATVDSFCTETWEDVFPEWNRSNR